MKLNSQQEQAVKHLEGPLLILAGAGSGKTRTITSRYEFLLDSGYVPEEILMVTFTRKAANEMKSRIKDNYKSLNLNETWVETFHRICIDILKTDGAKLGVPTDFKTCNNYESKRILQELITKFNLSGGSAEEEESVTKENSLEYISKLKTLLISPNALINEKPTLSCMNWEKASLFLEKIKNETPALYNALKIIYPEYQKILLRNRLMDFEDMMFYTVGLFDRCPEVLQKYQNKFKFIMVDEMQDTNHVQFKILELLAGTKRNICVVGDDAQSIYRFRGSELDNILGFDKAFPGTKIIKLEQNYRSTQRIVEFSNEIIKHNKTQKEKNLFTENELGEKIKIIEVSDDEMEAEVIAQEILKLNKEKGFQFSDVALLFRNNSHMNKFAKILDENKIPLQITGDTEFVDRTEVRDVLAYLNLLESPNDTNSLRRIINKPKRGIGPKAVEYIFENIGEDTYDFLKLNQRNSNFTKAGLAGIKELVTLINKCRPVLQQRGISAAINSLLEVLEYEKRIFEKSSDWVKDEVTEGLGELIRLAKKAEENNNMTVMEFRDYLSELYVDDMNQTDKVTLLTVHKSKGLEFPVVFVTGLDNVTFPNELKDTFDYDLEEERRVFYVAATRAEKLLYGTYPRSREKRIDGKMELLNTVESLFIKEIGDSDHVEKIVK